MLKAALIAATAFGVLSCSKEMRVTGNDEGAGNDGEGDDVRTVLFRAHGASTKVQFGEEDGGFWPTLWTDNDASVKLSLNYSGAQTAAVTPSDDYASATFSATIDFSASSAPYTYHVVSPASAAMALSPSREAWKVNIPCEQTPTEGSVDENAIIIASSAACSEGQGSDEVDIYFNHLTAYGLLSFANLDLDGATVQSIDLTATTSLAGNWYWACEAGQDGHELVDYGASSTITLHTSRTSDIWFACAPVDMSEEIMVVSVYTDAGVFEQMVSFPADRKFEAGRAAIFTIDMTDAEYTPYGSGSGTPSGDFTLVTDASTLAAGDEVLIVYKNGSKALGALSSNSSFRTDVDITISGDAISSEGDATILTLVAGTTAGTWAFQDGSNYLTSPSTASNNLLNSTSITANSCWDISITGGGLATVHAQAGSRAFLLYNPSSPRFTCYDSADKQGMQKVSIYRRSASGETGFVPDPILQETEYGCYLGSGLEWTYNPGTDQVTRSYDSYHKQTYTLINPSAVEELEIYGYAKELVKGDALLVTVSWRRGSTTVHTGSYAMKLVKDDGPRVWIGDGSGKGFIIKK